MRRVAGFTLVELVVVMFMLVVMMAVAMPSFVKMQESSSLRASAATMMATLRYARSMAVNRRVEVRLMFGEDYRSFHTESQRPTELGDVQFAPERTSLGRERTLPVGISLALTKGVSQEDEHLLAFHPNGSADTAVLTLANRNGRKLFVTLHPTTGRVQIQSDESKVAHMFTLEGR